MLVLYQRVADLPQDSDEDSDAQAGPSKKKRKKTQEAKQRSKQTSRARRKERDRAVLASGALPTRRPGFHKHGVKPVEETPAPETHCHAFDVDKWGYGAINGGSMKSTPCWATRLARRAESSTRHDSSFGRVFSRRSLPETL